MNTFAQTLFLRSLGIFYKRLLANLFFVPKKTTFLVEGDFRKKSIVKTDKKSCKK